MMSNQMLDNLVKIKKLNKELPNDNEFNGMVAAATIKLKDVGIEGLSVDSQFSLAYGAAHALSLAPYIRYRQSKMAHIRQMP